MLTHLETKNAEGRTPILVASFRSSAACCELLHAAGASVDVVDNRGNKPAELAGRVGRENSKELFEKWDLALNVMMAAIRLKNKMKKNQAAKAAARAAEAEAPGPFKRAAEAEAPGPLKASPFGRRAVAATGVNASPIGRRLRA